MIDEKKLRDHFRWMADNGWCWDYPDATIGDFFDIVGDDRKGLEKYLSGMETKDLWKISGLFSDISEKWPDSEMETFLDGLRRKIAEAGFDY